MPQDRFDKPSWTVQFDTGMAMTLSCAPPRQADGPAPKPAAPPAAEPPPGAGKL